MFILEMALTISRRQSFKTIATAAAVAGKSDSSAKPSIRLVVLDVGGTIIEDRGDVPEALRRAFAGQGIMVTPAEISEWRGASKLEIVQHFIQLRSGSPEMERTKISQLVYADFSARIEQAYKTAQPIHGAEEAFKKMRKSGLLLATTTGFGRALNDSIFHRLGWQDYFAATITVDDVSQGRPSPYMIFHAMESARVNSVSEVVNVGDTPLDLQAGMNAGVRGVIGVLSGASTSDRLKKEARTHLLPSVAELPELLKSKF
jgi:phosphonatase-like hydrolase